MIAQEDRACLTAVTTSDGTMEFGETIYVQFNPETLEITSTSKIEEEKGEKQNKTPVQVVAGSERRLSVQLIFDETLTGTDVRNRTTKIVAMMRTGEGTLRGYGRRGAALDVALPSVVLFEWGNMMFEGTISEITETLEYFSEGGIPLRASMKFSMTEQDAAFEEETGENSASPQDGMDLPRDQPLPPGSDVQDAAKKNGVENMRKPETDKLFEAKGSASGSIRGALGAQANGSVSVGGTGAAAAGGGLGARAGGSAGFGLPAAAMASGQSGFGASASAGVGADVGAGVGLGADSGGGVSLRAGAGLGVSGLDQNLSLGASTGPDAGLGMAAFAGLKNASATASGGAAKLQGGMAQIGGSAGLSLGGGGKGGTGGALFTAKAEVGAKVDLGALLFPEGSS